MAQELLDRYLKNVAKALPEAQREDILQLSLIHISEPTRPY